MATPTQAAPTVPAPANSEAPKEKKKGRKDWQLVYPSAEAATKEATDRTSGPRRAFTVVIDKPIPAGTHHVVAWNGSEGGGLLLEKLGASITEIGKPARTQKTASPDAIVNMLKNLSAEDRAKVESQLKTLLPHGHVKK